MWDTLLKEMKQIDPNLSEHKCDVTITKAIKMFIKTLFELVEDKNTAERDFLEFLEESLIMTCYVRNEKETCERYKNHVKEIVEQLKRT